MKTLIYTLAVSFVLASGAKAVEVIQMPEDLQTQFGLIDNVIQYSVDQEKIVLLGETHKSPGAFERVGRPFLKSLGTKGFDCLLLEWDESFNPALKKFSLGARYGDTIYQHSVSTYGELVTLSLADGYEKQVLESARELGFRIFAIDLKSSKSDHLFVFNMKSAQDSKTYLEIQMNRNIEMARKIAQLVNSNVCKKAVVVNGSSHIDPSEMAHYSDRLLVSIPDILQKARWKTKAFRLATDSRDIKTESPFATIFVYKKNAP